MIPKRSMMGIWNEETHNKYAYFLQKTKADKNAIYGIGWCKKLKPNLKQQAMLEKR
jgi:hypothetical protein